MESYVGNWNRYRADLNKFDPAFGHCLSEAKSFKWTNPGSNLFKLAAVSEQVRHGVLLSYWLGIGPCDTAIQTMPAWHFSHRAVTN